MKSATPRVALSAALGLVLLAPIQAHAVSATERAAKNSVNPQRLSEITRTLAADEYEGRAPGTPGETKTVAYLVEQFKAAGLEPGGAGILRSMR